MSAVASSTAAPSTTMTTDLFGIPTGACSIALSIAGLRTVPGDAPQPTSTIAFAAQPVNNPDIAGIGILIAFLATAYGIFIWMLVAYACRLLPASLLGQLDVFVFKRPAQKRSSPPWWQTAVDQTILAYADLQIATGVGILVAAFGTMNSLSVYHLQVAIYLAWMSSNTHLTAISLLQTEFRENRNKSIARRLRLGGMALLGVVLLVALVPTTAYNWLAIITQSKGTGHVIGHSHRVVLSPAGIPARCFWQHHNSGGLTPDAAWSFIILVLSYVWKGLLLFRGSQHLVKIVCRQWVLQPLRTNLDRLAELVRKSRRQQPKWILLRFKLAFSGYLAVWAVFELAQSFVVSLWICGAGLVWGSFQILVPRRRLPPQTLDAENSWTFGQILPIMLLAVPILSFAEGYTIQKAENDSKCDPQAPRTLKPCASDSSQNVETGLFVAQTATGHDADPAEASDTMSMLARIKSRPLVVPTSDLRDAEKTPGHRSRATDRLPPWRDDTRIYSSRFVVLSFWGSQMGILALATLFIVFYIGLFLPLGIPGKSKLEDTLQTDYGIWFIFGCTIAGWVGVAVMLLTCGAVFSTLFVVDDDENADQEEEEEP